MEKIRFTYGNFRYLVFELNHQYYLLDRRPCHLVGYLFPPINWLFFQHVYPITSDDYCKIKKKMDVLQNSLFQLLSVLG